MRCRHCGNENASMNRFCAYCGSAFSEDLTAAPRDRQVVSRSVMWAGFAISVVLPVVGVIIGVAYLLDGADAKVAAGRLWLITGLCSSVVFALVLAR
jgi:hypothetical protein